MVAYQGPAMRWQPTKDQLCDGGPKDQLCDGCCLSLDLHCLSCGHISKTMQDRPIVAMEHSYEIGIAYFIAAFRCFPDAALARCSGFIYKNVQIFEYERYVAAGESTVVNSGQLL